MDEEQLWAIYFAGVLALKFHPRNVQLPCDTFTESAVANAAHIADLALQQHMKRWPVEKEEQLVVDEIPVQEEEF